MPQTPDVLADPVGVVVGLICSIDSGLDREATTILVAGVAAGRVKRRRLAQALLDTPTLLLNGRSPAPRVVGDLLIALRRAGAAGISAPVCAECGKVLRAFQRRGEHWYCGVCGPLPEPCTGCGNVRPVARRDRAGTPHCIGCQPADGQDPVQILHDIIAAIDPLIDADTIISAVHAAAPQPGQRSRLAWALEDNPALLTGAGAEAPVPAVLRLIDVLCDAGAVGIVRPPCPHCGRVIALVKARDGIRSCRNCVAKSRAEPCFGCGAVREAASRGEHGEPLCSYCLITDPVNQKTCLGCGRRQPVSVRTPDGPLCPVCRPKKTIICSICTRSAPGQISKATGKPWCHACQNRRARCAGCGNVAPVRGGTISDPLCATCTRPDASFWHSCPGCGQQRQHRSGRCARCSLRQRLTGILGDGTGRVRPELAALHEALAGNDQPNTVLRWLNTNGTSTILAELAAGDRPLNHAALDGLPASKPIEHLRSVLVATGALPTRDEHLARLQRWITAAIAEREDTDQQHLLRRYALWHLLRRLRSRNNGTPATHGQANYIQVHVKAAVALLDWLTAHRLTLTTAAQGDLDVWLGSDTASYRNEAGHFIRWGKRNRLTSLGLATIKWTGPTRAIDTEARWDQIRQLLHDDTASAGDRVAALLVLLYAQNAAKISRLTLEHIEATDGEVRIRLGREPIVLPAPLDGLVLKLVASRRGHAVLGDQGISPWLFPGGQPGRAMSSSHLAKRLRQLGLRSGEARSTALFQLATELPAALLARLLGIHISVAVTWQRASSGDWTSYAADYSRRPPGTVETSAVTPPRERHSEGSNI